MKIFEELDEELPDSDQDKFATKTRLNSNVSPYEDAQTELLFNVQGKTSNHSKSKEDTSPKRQKIQVDVTKLNTDMSGVHYQVTQKEAST